MPQPALKNGARTILHSGLSVCECVRESVRPENLVNTISQTPMKKISPNFGRRCIWVRRCPGQLLGSKGQMSKSQQAMTRKTG